MGILKLIVAGVAVLLSAAAIAEEHAVEESGIEPQPLNAALEEFAAKSGLQVIYVAELANGKSSQGADPGLTDTATLDQLLASTDLEYEFLNDNTVTVQAVDEDERGASDLKNLNPTPILTAQNAPSHAQASTTSRKSDDGATSVVSGQVTDARTGTNLKGALVKIDETEQTTSTDTLGSFRFSSVAPGSYTLRISYLGYQEVVMTIDVRPGSAVERSIAMTGGDELEEILVYGTRSARAQSLNLERTSENLSTVIAADLLGNFNGTTISESLRRAPGIAFVPSEETGDGANIIVRGLEPDLNQITLNGLRLPEGSGLGRSADLSGLLTESIESVTINKTLLPSHDSNGAGALVEIETKSPLDRPKRFANLGVEYGERGNDFGDDLLATATVSGIFGSEEEFGASLSLQYRDRSITNLNYSSSLSGEGQYLPADITNPFGVDPTRLFPFERGVDEVYPTAVTTSSSLISDENLSITASLQKQISGHSDLRLDVTHGVVKTESYSSQTAFDTSAAYVLQPIAELGGEQRWAYLSENFIEEVLGIEGLPGMVGGAFRESTWIPKRESKTTTVSLRGNTELDKLVFDYKLGYAKGSSETPFSGSVGLSSSRGFGQLVFPVDFLTDEIRSNTVNGLVVSPFAPLVPNSLAFILPGLTPEGFDFFGEIDNVPVVDSARSETRARFGASGDNERVSFSGSARRNFDGSPIRYLEVGLFYEDAGFTSLRALMTDTYSTAGGATTSELGLAFDAPLLSRVGVSGGFPGLSRISVEQFFQSVDALSAAGLLNIRTGSDNRERATAETDELNSAAYLQARVDIGKLEIIGGARIDRTEIDSTFFVSPSFTDALGVADRTYRDRFGQRVSSSVSQTDVLPRLITNYRLSDTMIFRAGYFLTASRPQVRNLTQPGRAARLDLRPRYGPNGDQPRLSLAQGNPGLKPAFTDNFDASWEWYHDAVGVMKVSGFYKVIKNSLTATFEDGGLEILPAATVLPNTPEFNDLPDNVFVSVSTPVNADTNDKIWGAEFAFERQLTFLPGLWSGFGFYGNYTYADSSRDVELFNGATSETFILEGVPFSGSPKHSGTASLTYNKYGFDANLTWTTQARRLASLGQNGLDNFAESIETLDFRAEYITETNLRLYLQARDLLTGENDTYLRNSVGGESGVPKYFTGASYFGGRSFSVGVAASF